jgi:alkanesulfonate monooxygenase SsuD/methylene tetrahydromethanopterin reductase-like flavin-dependent oxidoreductase (luciferase family)
MKFGLKLNTQFREGQDRVQGTRELIEQVAAAREAGFDSVWVSQHYLPTPYQALQTFPLLGRIAAEMGDMTIGTSIFLLTLANPVYAAEQAATMDVLTGGRFVFGVGLGYRKEEFEAFGVDARRRASRFRECLDVAIRLWTEDEVTHRGEHFTLTGARLLLKPVQEPHPPIWMAASSDAAVRRAAEYGFPWLINPHASLATLEGQMDLYRSVAAQQGHPMPDTVPMFKELSIAETRADAFEVARPFLEKKYASYASWGLDKPMPKSESLSAPFVELARDRFIMGTPEDVSTELERYHKSIGANHLVLRMQWPGMPQEDVLRQIRLLGREVIPAWRRP